MPKTRGPIGAALIGVWTLRQYCDITEGLPPQHPFGLNPEGLLIYTADGFVSALLMAPGRPNLSGDGLRDGTPDQYAASGRGFIGYSGVYDVDEDRAVVTHEPFVAFAPNMIGTGQKRLVELNGDVLVLTAEHAQRAGLAAIKSRLEWARVKAGQTGEEL
jgi:Lipocalin-like domain